MPGTSGAKTTNPGSRQIRTGITTGVGQYFGERKKKRTSTNGTLPRGYIREPDVLGGARRLKCERRYMGQKRKDNQQGIKP